MRELGGIPGCVSCDPEIAIIDWDSDLDYVLLACDGVFDVLSNDEVNDIIWETINSYKSRYSKGRSSMPAKIKEECLDNCVNNILKMSMIDKSEDNITVILVLLNDVFSG